MKKNKKRYPTEDYEIIIAELGINPYRTLNTAFALMTLIPFLVLFYILIGKYLLHYLLLGINGFVISIAIFISLIGFFYYESVVRRLVEKLLLYSAKCKRADEQKSAFVVNVSHEFRSPLSIIGGSLRHILDTVSEEISPEQKEIIVIAKKQVDRLSRLVINLLDLSKIEAGKMELSIEDVDIVALVEEILLTYREELSKKQIVLKKDIPQDKYFLRADRDKLSEVVINLLSNAIKYTPTGGHIVIKLDASVKEIRFEILDSGVGIPKEDFQKIFDKFERVTAERQEGTGLGLPIAKDIVELHQGKIWVESEVPKGSRFIFVLPRDSRML